MAQCWAHALVVACFGAFVRYNGGVAVGDKDQHKAMLHLPQPLYFSAFCVASVRKDTPSISIDVTTLGSAATQSVASILQIFFHCLRSSFKSLPASLPFANPRKFQQHVHMYTQSAAHEKRAISEPTPTPPLDNDSLPPTSSIPKYS